MSPNHEQTNRHPDRSVQGVLGGAWWVEDSTREIQPGRLVWAVVPHVDIQPWTLIPTGREGDNTANHKKFECRVEPVQIWDQHRKDFLPVAAMPLFGKEKYLIHRAKLRVALVLASDWDSILPTSLTLGMADYQASSPYLIAPFFGVEQTPNRRGWPPNLVSRIQHGMYRQFFWDLLPKDGGGFGSILRFDHIQPVGRHHNYIRATEYRLGDEAVDLIREWLDWVVEGTVPEDSELDVVLKTLAEAMQP